MEHINIVQIVKQIGHNANVRKQEEEIVVGIVLILVRRGEVAARPGTRKQKQYVTGSWVRE